MLGQGKRPGGMAVSLSWFLIQKEDGRMSGGGQLKSSRLV